MSKILPQVSRCIRPPRLDHFQIQIWMKCEDPLENQVRFRKRVGVSRGAKADIFRRPGPKAFGFENRPAERGEILAVGEGNSSVQHPPAEFANRLAAGARRLDGA